MTSDYCTCGHDSERHDDNGVCFGMFYPEYGPDRRCTCKRFVPKDNNKSSDSSKGAK